MRTLIGLIALTICLSVMAARTFIAASSQSAISLTSPIADEPLTIACWVNFTTTNSSSTLVAIQNTSAGRWSIAWSSGSAQLQAVTSTGAATSTANGTAGAIAPGTWYHVCAVFGSSASRILYVNGVSNSVETTSRDTAASGVPDRITLGYRYGSTTFSDSALAEVGIWNVALSESEIAQLSSGFSPRRVRPDAMVRHWRCIEGNLIDISGGTTMTLSNSPALSVHPRIYP